MHNPPDVREFLRSSEVLVFDMGDTFMFNCDRFSTDQDFEAVYHSLGGDCLTNQQLIGIIDHIYQGLLTLARDEKDYTSYPSLGAYIKSDPWFNDNSEKELELIQQVFGIQECGQIPESSSTILKTLNQDHRLGLISNIWADKGIFCQELQAAGVYDLFEILVFSSEQGVIKPAPGIFQPVIDHFCEPTDQLVYIGNSYKRDVLGAAGAGMQTVLVDNGPASEVTGNIKPDFTIKSIEELV